MRSFATTLPHGPNWSCLLRGSSRLLGQIDDTHPKKSIVTHISLVELWNFQQKLNVSLEGVGQAGRQGCFYCHGTSPSELTSLIKPSIFHSMRRVQLLKAAVLASFIHPIFGNVRPSSDCLADSHSVSSFYRPTTSYSLLVGQKLSGQRTRFLVPVFR
jgi:hypothetical protein